MNHKLLAELDILKKTNIFHYKKIKDLKDDYRQLIDKLIDAYEQYI